VGAAWAHPNALISRSTLNRLDSITSSDSQFGLGVAVVAVMVVVGGRGDDVQDWADRRHSARPQRHPVGALDSGELISFVDFIQIDRPDDKFKTGRVRSSGHAGGGHKKISWPAAGGGAPNGRELVASDHRMHKLRAADRHRRKGPSRMGSRCCRVAGAAAFFLANTNKLKRQHSSRPAPALVARKNIFSVCFSVHNPIGADGPR
jgi:hypothetical protein